MRLNEGVKVVTFARLEKEEEIEKEAEEAEKILAATPAPEKSEESAPVFEEPLSE
jgi:hypothetical protein